MLLLLSTQRPLISLIFFLYCLDIAPICPTASLRRKLPRRWRRGIPAFKIWAADQWGGVKRAGIVHGISCCITKGGDGGNKREETMSTD